MERTGRECGLGRTQDWGFSSPQPVEWAAGAEAKGDAVDLNRRRQTLPLSPPCCSGRFAECVCGGGGEGLTGPTYSLLLVTLKVEG